MRGKLIVIEGLDSSGKATQTKALCKRLEEQGYRVKQLTFPDYDSPSSALVKMYLNGELAPKADEINPYAASSFYAVDRFASYKQKWESFYLEGGVVVADRYTTSNMIHQAAKIEDKRIKNLYLDWLYDYEFKLLQLPTPDQVIFLDMPPVYANELMAKRANKITGEMAKDIHEKDNNYLERSYINALYVAEKFDWNRVFCVDSGQVRSIEEINQEIWDMVLKTIKG